MKLHISANDARHQNVKVAVRMYCYVDGNFWALFVGEKKAAKPQIRCFMPTYVLITITKGIFNSLPGLHFLTVIVGLNIRENPNFMRLETCQHRNHCTATQ